MKNNLLNKDHESFWQSWKAKFKARVKRMLLLMGLIVTLTLLTGLRSISRLTPVAMILILVINVSVNFYCCMMNMSSNPTVISTELISVELINKCLDSMQIGKAPGNDNIEVEHLLLLILDSSFINSTL